MSATAALILLMDASMACTTHAPAPPRVGADVVPAILDFQSQPFEPSLPTPAGVGGPRVEAPTDAKPEADRRDAEPAAWMQCEVTPITIA